MAADDTNRDRLPVVDDVIEGENAGRFRLTEVLGEGGYGTVFKAQQENKNMYVAVKTEKWSKTVLRIELGVLRATKNCRHFCTLFDYGKVVPEFMFIVMSLLGPDLAKLRNDQSDRHFTLPTALRVAIQTITAIEELHSKGFINRDIKPGNFAIGNKNDGLEKLIFMFDFGLARKFIDKNSNIFPPRKEPGWRGTTRYGSLEAHKKNDLGRKDDLESWLYSIVEMTKGNLPWRLVADRDKVQEAKIHARNKGRSDFFKTCPKQYDVILELIDGLSFESTPPYEEMKDLLIQCCNENDVMMEQKYDWEDDNSSLHVSITTRNLDQSPTDQHRAVNNPEDRIKQISETRQRP